jgi:hypothetical protein
MSEHLTPQPCSEDEPKPSPGMPKTADYSVRLSRDVRSGTGRSLLGASVRSRQPDPSHGDGGVAAEHLDVGDQHGRVPGARADPAPFPHRFEELPPAIFLEHYVEERTPEGQLGRKATWDRLSFHSWAPRRVWLSGRERIAFGDPHWEHLPERDVETLIGRHGMHALPPPTPLMNDHA